ncbi:MAG: biopolymer transporter ExbD [Chlamydiales bacterium]
MKRYKQLEEAQVNLTPLIDVMFVILIMFIAVAPLLEIDRVELASSSSLQSNPILEKNPITIHVYADNSIAYNRHSVTLKELEGHLRKAQKRYPEGHPQLYHDSKATFGTYQQVKNVIEKSGFSQIDVILKPD